MHTCFPVKSSKSEDEVQLLVSRYHNGLVCVDFCRQIIVHSFPSKNVVQEQELISYYRTKVLESSSSKHICDFCFLCASTILASSYFVYLGLLSLYRFSIQC